MMNLTLEGPVIRRVGGTTVRRLNDAAPFSTSVIPGVPQSSGVKLDRAGCWIWAIWATRS